MTHDQIAFRKTSYRLLGIILLAMLLLTHIGCRKSTNRLKASRIGQNMAAQSNKSDHLRDAMRYLDQLTPFNRKQATKEVVIQINTWLDGLSKSQFPYVPPKFSPVLPTEFSQRSEYTNPTQLTFDQWDVDFLFQSRMLNKLSSWVVANPVRDPLILPAVEKAKQSLNAEEANEFEEAFKLFDWTVRNVWLEGEAKDVERLQLDPRGKPEDTTMGCGQLPWETILFARGDYVERGRAFTALAKQRGIETVWLSINGTTTSPGYLWAVGVVIDSNIYLFDMKLGLPILDPDTLEFATLEQARKNDRVLRRLKLPGEFDYAVNPGDLESLAFLLDVLPCEFSARMNWLEKSLTGNERMRLYQDVDNLVERLQQISPNDAIAVWNTPLMSVDQAIRTRQRLESSSEFTTGYMFANGVWLMDSAIGKARFKHVRGEFLTNLDSEGAPATYVKSIVDDETIEKLAFNPDVQKEMGMIRGENEEMQVFEARVRQAQMFIAQSKFLGRFMLAHLHYDRGDYENSVSFCNRILTEDRAAPMHSSAKYLLGRCSEQLTKSEEAEANFTAQPSSQEAGNRLRARYLKR